MEKLIPESITSTDFLPNFKKTKLWQPEDSDRLF